MFCFSIIILQKRTRASMCSMCKDKFLQIIYFQSVYPLHFGDADGNYVTQYYCNDYDDRISLVYTIYQVSLERKYWKYKYLIMYKNIFQLNSELN